MIANNSRIVFFGDSLTHRTGVTVSPIPARRFCLDYSGSYVDILVKRVLIHFPESNFTYHNLGIGGNTVEDLLGRVEDVLELEPDWVVLFIGQNDANRFSLDEYARNLEKLLQIFSDKGIGVIQLSTSPGLDEQKDEILDNYDKIIEKFCLQFGNQYVDGKTPFTKVLTCNNKAEHAIPLFNQGCHMSELGNMLLADLVFDILADL